MSSSPHSDETRDRYSGSGSAPFHADDAIDLRDLFTRLFRGLPQIAGLALLGLVLAAVGFLVYSPYNEISTSTRVSFAFPGFDKGEYPDRSRFQADDIRAPDIIAEALKRRGLNTSAEVQSEIRSAITITGIVPANIIKERDRIRATGQTPPTYIPDEYNLSLILPSKHPFTTIQREQLLKEIVTVYRDNFRRTYADTPLTFGNALNILRNADYPDYESVFDKEIRGLTGFLSMRANEAKSFRSPTTNLTFNDLLRHAQLFSQIRLNETLGLIHQNGLSRNRKIALVKMNDELRLVGDEERRALDDEAVIKDLLAQTQNRDQNYILGVKSQLNQPRTNSPLIDQGVIESLLANDAYSFLVRRALEAGLKVKQVQADKGLILERIENMKSFTNENPTDQSAVIAEVKKSTEVLEREYSELVDSIRKTHADFTRQEYGNAIRISDIIKTSSILAKLMIPSALGLFLGFALGSGLSLLRIYIGKKQTV